MERSGVPDRAAGGEAQEIAAAAPHCASCGAPRSGPYCARCGQPEVTRPIRLRDLTRRFLSDLLDAEQGFLHTLSRLFRNPAGVVRDYLRGSTVRYTSPGKYFILSMAAVQLVALWSGVVGEFATGFAESLQAGEAERVGELLDRYFVIFSAPSVLVVAAVQRWLLRGGLRFAEHLVFALFVCAQQSLLWIPLIPLSAVRDDLISSSAFIVGMLATAGYYLLAIRRFFGLSWPSTLMRGAMVLGLSILLSSLFLAALLGILTVGG